jgi:hypothetical protein
MLYQLSYTHHEVVTCGEAGGTRTPVHRLRRPMLYPAELLPRSPGPVLRTQMYAAEATWKSRGFDRARERYFDAGAEAGADAGAAFGLPPSADRK